MANSVRSGPWSAPNTWNTGRVPGAGEAVEIMGAHEITYDVLSNEVLGTVAISGTLRVSRQTNTRLRVGDNIIVESGGLLDMGTPDDFIPDDVTCAVIWNLTQAQSRSYQGGVTFTPSDKGLWAMSGSEWHAHGAPILRTWSKLAQTAPAGASEVILQHNVADWSVGGQVVVTMTNRPEDRRSGPWQNELRVIASIEPLSGGRSRVRLDRPLSFTHEANADFQGEVGLLTRNVLFKTEIEGVAEATLINDVTSRLCAHTMWMNGAVGQMQYVELKFMGHYALIGRYPVHTHIMRDFSRGMALRGNSVEYSGFRFYDIHTSHAVTIEDNVGYGCVGSGYYAESVWVVLGKEAAPDGVSLDTAWVHNLSIDCMSTPSDTGNDQLVAFRRMGAFWPIGSLGEALLGNVAVSTRGTATDTAGFSTGEGFAAGDRGGEIGVVYVHNESHSNGEHGDFRWHNKDQYFDFVDFKLWRNGQNGTFVGAYNPNIHFYNTEIRQNGSNQIEADSVPTYFQDCIIQGDGGGTGYFFRDPHVTEVPEFPTRHVRNLYQDLAVGIDHRQDPCHDAAFENDPSPGKECVPNYADVIGPVFEGVTKPMHFGHHWNANSFYHVADPVGMAPGLGDNFWLCRNDQLPPTAPVSQEIIGDGSDSFRDAGTDAVVTRDAPWADYPPEVSITATLNGKVATIRATADDDFDTPVVEIFVDWIRIARRTSPPYEATVDLSAHPRKFAYLYAVAYDNTAVRQEKLTGGKQDPVFPYLQRGYSNVIELGPEVLVGLPPPPPPPPPEGPLDPPVVVVDAGGVTPGWTAQGVGATVEQV